MSNGKHHGKLMKEMMRRQCIDIAVGNLDDFCDRMDALRTRASNCIKLANELRRLDPHQDDYVVRMYELAIKLIGRTEKTYDAFHAALSAFDVINNALSRGALSECQQWMGSNVVSMKREDA